MAALRQIRYKLHGFRMKARPCKGDLLAFVYDIPYSCSCGVFPPFHIINQILSSGGSTGGMSPGTTWKPFTITEAEYAALVDAVKNTPRAEVKSHARFQHLPPKFDPAFDHIQDHIEWFKAVCKKHRDSWHAELEAAGALEANE